MVEYSRAMVNFIIDLSVFSICWPMLLHIPTFSKLADIHHRPQCLLHMLTNVTPYTRLLQADPHDSHVNWQWSRNQCLKTAVFRWYDQFLNIAYTNNHMIWILIQSSYTIAEGIVDTPSAWDSDSIANSHKNRVTKYSYHCCCFIVR